MVYKYLTPTTSKKIGLSEVNIYKVLFYWIFIQAVYLIYPLSVNTYKRIYNMKHET